MKDLKLTVSIDRPFSWQSQAKQYPAHGPRGISYFAGTLPEGTVDCLLYRDKRGILRGILNYYAQDFPPYEKAGNVNVWVDPRFQRKRIATKLLDEAERRWKIDWEQQQYTLPGAMFAKTYLDRKYNLKSLGPTFERAEWHDPGVTPEEIAQALGIPLEYAREAFEHTQKEIDESETWVNNTYQVIKRRINNEVYHLSIRRQDREPIHDWRDLQRIKNELVGPEHEGFELYPAESRLVDTSNQYHLYVFVDPAYRIPHGFTARAVTKTPFGRARQRPFSEE